jgi:hypothetical protein
MRDYYSPGGPTKPSVALLVICSLLALMPMVGEAEAVSPQTVDIAPNCYVAIQFSGSSAVPSSYQVTVVSGPNIDVILTNLSGYVEYMNGGSESIPHSFLGTDFDTRYVSYYGDLTNETYCLIIDNTAFGTAQPSGQTVRVTYSYGTGGAGIPPSSDFFASLFGVFLIGGPIILIAIVAIIAWMTIKRGSRMRHSPLSSRWRRNNDPADRSLSTQSYFDPQKPHRVYLQAKSPVRPILVHAIGRCPNCNGIIADEWAQCTKCDWPVDRSKLRPFK